MPSGVRYLKAMGHHNIPWAWATNAFFTVIGTALVVLIASITGFPFVFYVAAALYVIAPFFFRTGTPKQAP
jgi:type III secretory pathway component EscV